MICWCYDIGLPDIDLPDIGLLLKKDIGLQMTLTSPTLASRRHWPPQSFSRSFSHIIIVCHFPEFDGHFLGHFHT